MPTAGYSETPLIKKLGLRQEHKIWLINPPDDYTQLLQTDISTQLCSPKILPDWVHLFAASTGAFHKAMTRLQPVYQRNTQLIIWASWYKKSAGIKTDLTENYIRDYALQNGLVDIKVCAVSHQWSGLKLVVPLSQR